MACRNINGRAVIDRAGIAELTGAALSTVDKWSSNRQRYGFPLRLDSVQGAWWYLDDIEQFWTHYRKAHQAALNRVDRTGDPNELISAPQAASVLGYNSTADLPTALLNLADDITPLPSGRLRRKWQRRTLWAWAEDHVGHQRTGRPTGPKGPRGTIDHHGNPHELVNSTEAARILGYAHRKHLPTDLLNQADQTQPMTDGRKRRKWQRQTLWNWELTKHLDYRG
ncbi:MAG TPA: hypothetical protein VJS64_03100 [Pyrinomonadaceae bacterium]|nr:hypothetical protein [Pyrinomonadaceae bacterium]